MVLGIRLAVLLSCCLLCPWRIPQFTDFDDFRLEQMEQRLKDDVLKEAARCHGLVLVHDELPGSGQVVPSMICADSVQTTRELFEELRNAMGFRVRYWRIPISPEQRPEDKYLDEYVQIVRRTRIGDPLVFNCGMGVGRSALCVLRWCI